MITTIMAFLGSAGFSFLFGVRGRKIAVLGAGASVGWIVYLAAARLGADVFFANFAAALTVEVLSSFLAIGLKSPVTVMQIPLLIPLIPGGDLYYMMYNLISQDFTASAQYSNQVLIKTGAIVLGIVVGANVMRMLPGIGDLRLRRHSG